MPQIESNFSSYLNASPETVFENISELTRHAAWAANALTIEAVSEGPAAVGSEYRSSCRFMGKDINAEIKVTELEAPMRYGFSVKDNNGDFQHDLTLRAQNGGTQADHRVTGQLSLMNWLLFVLFGDRMIGRPGMRNFYQNMNEALEKGAS